VPIDPAGRELKLRSFDKLRIINRWHAKYAGMSLLLWSLGHIALDCIIRLTLNRGPWAVTVQNVILYAGDGYAIGEQSQPVATSTDFSIAHVAPSIV
jgi:hypothetical protein